MEEKIHVELEYLKLEFQPFSTTSSSSSCSTYIDLTSHVETMFYVCCVPLLELKSKILKFCHQIRVSKTQDAQGLFGTLTWSWFSITKTPKRGPHYLAYPTPTIRHPTRSWLSLSLSLFLFALVVLLVETVWTSKRIHKEERIRKNQWRRHVQVRVFPGTP